MAEKPATDPAVVSPDDADTAANPGNEARDMDPAAELKRERDDYYDRWVRKTAEFDNYRKRVERERREQADSAVTGLLEDLLAIVDDFDRALTVEPSTESDSYRKGIELIHGKFHDLLRKRGVRPIEALGADFDPNVHQAVVHEVSPDHREGEVIGELRRGYMIGDRLLRPSMVKVAKA